MWHAIAAKGLWVLACVWIGFEIYYRGRAFLSTLPRALSVGIQIADGKQ